MALTAEKKRSLVESYRCSDQDTGSPEVQVSILTHRIIEMTRHLQANRHDFASRRGLLRMVSRRTRAKRSAGFSQSAQPPCLNLRVGA